jgi:hypothetical protein
MWAEFAGIFARTPAAHLGHEHAKAELKKLVPEDSAPGDLAWSPGQALENGRH